MITSVRFENYRCLRDVTIRLGPLTAIVGPNGSGKSTVLRGLSFPFPNQWPRGRWRNDKTLDLKRIVSLDEGQTTTFSVSAAGAYSDDSRQVATQLLTLDLKVMRAPNGAARANRLGANGENLANTFASLARAQQIALVETFVRLVPLYGDVNAKPATTGSGLLELVFQDRWSTAIEYSTDEVSDGTMLAFALLLLSYQPDPPSLLLIEEPERGIHPVLLGQLVEIFRAMSTGELGPKPVQIVLATHSAELLDFLEPSEVRFMSRNRADGSALVNEAPADSDDWRAAYSEYQNSLGNIWLSGALGGMPGA